MQFHWPFGKKLPSANRRVVVMHDDNALMMLVADKGEVIAITQGPRDELKDQTDRLKEQSGFVNARTTLVLNTNQYQMLLVEAPPVEASELAEALRWKVKDLLPGSVEDSVVDGFLLPEDAYRGRQKMAYTVATSKGDLQALVDQLDAEGLMVDRVEIPELVLLRVLEQHHMAEQAEMVVVIGETGGFMVVIADHAIYLSRKLEISAVQLTADAAAKDALIERMVLELQRSRDYFESQIGKGVISRILLASPSGEEPIASVIEETLGNKVTQLDIGQFLPLPDQVKALFPQAINADHVLMAGAAQA